uniref:Uncharacterized protein n=1 Tax=Percolomonas cosmopolitus TaxID=63605 RepID=A0A7S1KR32_9EUKA|mmetsp:Transcript_5963/g.22637  ORF Transcript_5963/g.22637 Transcript_5963/m.22637 type:complete len:221 (+) Transcript_5963:405-1067(+)|eukprot:CAMPEP_0117440354 /NCGR_PEP_ID=MMETSP0759-20121206/3045_1 /TAXON_ID=63605 /ORGANISM="Percolomonas cosmopolitus, Strain WS" /LENGTH=220 /DNA_ID=CAMNT_0005232113 /DNA_START=327 /DNA_END=989 /DNA_ORIENTATION=+
MTHEPLPTKSATSTDCCFFPEYFHRLNSISPPVWYTYLRVNHLLIAYAVVSFFVGFFAIESAYTNYLQEGPASVSFLWSSFLCGFVYTNVVLSQFDATSRFQTYKKAKDMLHTTRTVDDRKMWPYVVSLCQRNAVRQAARELDMEQMILDYFRQKGYKFYHVIPDFCVQYPLFWMSAKFWNFTFFHRYYEAKIDYEEIYQQQLRRKHPEWVTDSNTPTDV